MGLMNMQTEGSSPIQQHSAMIATDLMWVHGELETLGDPFLHLDKTSIDFLRVFDARVKPWSFTGLPTSQTPELLINKSNVQCVIFDHEEIIAKHRASPRVAPATLYLPLMVMRGMIPLYSDAKPNNFLDFWNAQYVPVVNASIHFLVEVPTRLAQQVPLVQVRADQIQAFVPA